MQHGNYEHVSFYYASVFIALHRCCVLTNWGQDCPPAERLDYNLLYWDALESNQQYLQDVPVLIYLKPKTLESYLTLQSKA